MATSKNNLDAYLKQLNRAAGFGEGPRYIFKKDGTSPPKRIGKGFMLDYAYGNVALVYANFAKNTGQYNVSDRMSSSAMASCLNAMRRGFELKKTKQ